MDPWHSKLARSNVTSTTLWCALGEADGLQAVAFLAAGAVVVTFGLEGREGAAWADMRVFDCQGGEGGSELGGLVLSGGHGCD